MFLENVDENKILIYKRLVSLTSILWFNCNLIKMLFLSLCSTAWLFAQFNPQPFLNYGEAI